MAVRAPSRSYLESVQDVKLACAVFGLLFVVTNELTDGSQPLLVHSPFPSHGCHTFEITLVEQSSITKLHMIPCLQRS